MSRSPAVLAFAAVLSLGAGCFVRHDPNNCAVVRDQLEPVAPLGPSGSSGYHLLANAGTSIPACDIGYLVTANGRGGYRVVFTDTLGSPATFTGSISTDGTFDAAQTQKFSGAENVQLSAANRIDFSGVPGNSVEGVDTVSSTDPIYVDLLIDGSHAGVAIYFTGAQSAQVTTSGFNPVAFTSP